MRKSTKIIGWTGAAMAGAMLLFALLGPMLIPHDAYQQTGASFQGPNAEHWLGTNDMGQDILAELAVGARTSLFIGIATAVIATFIGGIIGVLSGYFGGWFETLMLRLIDVVLTLPFLPLMIVIAVYIGPGAFTQIFVITLVMWAGKARQIRAQTLSIKKAGPVLAAKSMGAGHFYLFRKHILPGVFPLFIPQFVAAVNAAILLESSLSFLGMSDPLMKSWGSILYYANNRSAFLTEAWVWWIIPPGVCIVLVVLAFSFIGYYLEEKVNPRLSAYVPSPKRPKQSILLKQELLDEDIVLSINNMTVEYPKKGVFTPVVSGVSLRVHKGEVLGIVGESGSGKTTVASAIIQQLKEPARLSVEGIYFEGKDLQKFSDEEIRSIRGNKIGYIAQAAMNALNPVISVEKQLAEAILAHHKMPAAELNQRIDESLLQVGLDLKWRHAFPHELSGGMRQRVIIAMALINRPEFVIADEPTTGLDVMVQVEILELLQRLQQELNLSMIFISHDLPAVLKITDRLAIMKYGYIVDGGPSAELAESSTHPYTRRLIDAMPLLTQTKRKEVLSK
ncbi:dipeptide/oligopeptide/nickel ABC transporter permease/ATP-binding protein [Planococcus sp. APC 3900]|uniref:dipeptide/oligopeptide/nickel ABC transporter permease/ATP-binding protein n=1 Tax=Planococcus sp. APC 3900 TaxID=3035191 RepID=UPI0025B5058B|nr:dipeptide/oligopeptide/nickel ABC transporter permease/ATP-binding protein [Planococcus sp. APC 3900]MDN3438727.1 dipeptide/oligopeptide/nickel ABC transporter permease/ATP-binding protein [Planococcus sp. APC 3900]